MWRSNKKAWVTRDIFTDWINEVFGPSVKKYLLEMNLPLHVLLVMDNAPAHPPSLQNDLLEEYNFIKIQFLPPNTTPLLQPMDQQVISNFKKLYTKALFERCFEVTEGTNFTLTEFWKYHFHIVACLKMIEKAWEGITKRTLTSAWKKLWPESVVECDVVGFETVVVSEDPVVNEIVSLSNMLRLEVDHNYIDELIEEHSQELTTEELMELHCASQQEGVEEEEVTSKQQSSGEIREMLKAWESVASYIEKHHPNKTVAMRATNIFNDNAVSHFYQILKGRQKQMSLDSFLVKRN
ncbi:tigger transposable element-derived protein 1-like [Colletes gigas]|uniref:tigger transposable element-derived protein 1-like n=1 Tax=Colletes gigas TaxID=935657 RepID=UPI001C9AE349|nr:tigger transposable element-derived protein 1-like [Colletes gigas]